MQRNFSFTKPIILFLAAALFTLFTGFLVTSNSKDENLENNRRKRKPKKRKYPIEWVSIPAGTFTMGSPKTEADRDFYEDQHQVTLSAFKISKYEITFKQYDQFCDSTHREKPSDEGWGRGNRPVINVGWEDAEAFAEWMGCRLPTEAEWEYATRAGTTTPFNTGTCLTLKEANFNATIAYPGCTIDKFREKTKPVGSYAPNAWGLYDTHGNVWEWCSDWYNYYTSESKTNPTGGPKNSNETKVMRGGGWRTLAYECRSAARGYGSTKFKYLLLGFRVAMSE